MTIKDVKVWKNKEKTDVRIYVHSTDDREGCLYLTGNKWNVRNSVTGDLTEEEWQEARQLALRNETWHTTYAQPFAATKPVAKQAPGRGNHGIVSKYMNPGWGRCGRCFDCIAE